MSHQIVYMTKHLSIYRGFTIQRLPRSVAYPNHRYQVTKDGLYYGQDFAQAEAVKIIDTLCAAQQEWVEKLSRFAPSPEVTNVSVINE